MALSTLFSSSSNEWFTAERCAELRRLVRSSGESKDPPEQQCHPLILDGLCLHVLSSFQRTVRLAPLGASAGAFPRRPIVFRGTLQSYKRVLGLSTLSVT